MWHVPHGTYGMTYGMIRNPNQADAETAETSKKFDLLLFNSFHNSFKCEDGDTGDCPIDTFPEQEEERGGGIRAPGPINSLPLQTSHLDFPSPRCPVAS
jgi:hypothetical protein